MKDEWYGDKRDIVKWSVLLHLANENSAQRIVQIAYYRQRKWNHILINDQTTAIPVEVLKHFRDVKNIIKISSYPKVDVFDYTIRNRRSYFPEVVKFIEQNKDGRKIVFLDPDTGLAPANATLKHVLPSELSIIWRILLSGDLLVFYQHKTNRGREPWIPEKRNQFVAALGIPDDEVKIAYGPDIANDVVFFYCRKGNDSSNSGAA